MIDRSRISGTIALGQPTHQELLESFERKVQIICDRVASVAHGYHSGCYIVGRPGTSKTFTVKKELDRLEAPSTLQNARMTPMGLFSFIAEHPEHVIVLDDIPSLFKNDQAMQILMAALDGKPGQPRKVTYKSKDQDIHVLFSGAIIAISNLPLRRDPLAQALGSRVVMLEHEPTDEEIAAFMQHLAAKGHADLSSEECLEVVKFVIAETRSYDMRLDLRHLNKAWQDFRQDKHGRLRRLGRISFAPASRRLPRSPFFRCLNVMTSNSRGKRSGMQCGDFPMIGAHRWRPPALPNRRFTTVERRCWPTPIPLPHNPLIADYLTDSLFQRRLDEGPTATGLRRQNAIARARGPPFFFQPKDISNEQQNYRTQHF